MHQLTVECNAQLEEKLQQFNADCSKKIRVLAQQLDELQQDSQQRFEAMQIEATRRHETTL